MSGTKKISGLGGLTQSGIDFPDADKGYHCPCCGQYCRRYYRKLNSNMAVTMIALFRKKKFGFVNIEEFLRVNGYKRSGDFPYLVHWGLMEKLTEPRPDGSSRNGFYKLTDKGRQFVLQEIKVKSTLIFYNGKCEGFEGDEIGIEKALGKRFDYRELMDGDYKIQSV